ncbi:P-II family nitrogen regulator [Symmachiella macrocystis]|uniref:P-II family nitrogen regulator n=1 Tax=Symmachiella macrocystis TaxID=2527985 RepID=UPI0036F1C015
MVELGASGYTSQPCSGAGRHDFATRGAVTTSKVRIEVIVPDAIFEGIIKFLRQDVLPSHRVTVSVELVDVVRRDHFD